MLIFVVFAVKWWFRNVNHDRPAERFYLPLTIVMIA